MTENKYSRLDILETSVVDILKLLGNLQEQISGHTEILKLITNYEEE
jgi:hypothetical protein